MLVRRLVSLATILAIAAISLSVALGANAAFQPATPSASPGASPAASPGASPVASPGASPAAVALPPGDVARGQALAVQCLACHSTNGTRIVGPTWKGLYGSKVELESGKTVTADAAYLYQSITNPSAETVKGYPANTMPVYSFLTPQNIADLIAYIESLK